MERINDRLLNWASILDEQTRAQAEIASGMPFIYPHLALMPDAHLGKGATVGSVIPTLGTIMPAAVGVDIGCGMIAVRTDLTVDQLPDDRKPLREAIEWAIPLSAGRHNNKIVATAEPKIAELEYLASGAGLDRAVASWYLGLDDFVPNWRKQLGSLGSGNHFIEVTVDEEQRVWLFLHSGSRGVGNKLAVRHIAAAQEYCAKHYISLPDRDLAYLVEGTLEFEEYITDLNWAQRFAFLNREEMMDRVIRQFSEWVGVEWTETERINCHHNYTELMPEELVSRFRTGNRRSDSQQPEPPSGAVSSTVPDSLDGYPSVSRSYGELVRAAQEIAQASVPSQGDALVRSQIWSLTDDLERVSERSRSHPRSGHPDSSLSDPRSESAAEVARKFLNTLEATHPSAARSVADKWDKRHREVSAHEQRLSVHANSLSLQNANSGDSHVWLSRKGAIDATLGRPGLIPGSMGTASYVVEGRGNPLALNSSPHGAGREYSRSRARKTFTREQLETAMEGIEWRHTDAFLDEIPQAYKNIDVVMEDAADLVEIKHTLRQIVNVKGD